jgi:hypothetical protein
MSRARLAYGAAMAAIVAALFVHIHTFGSFVGDDAYITFRYADNLAHHGQLVWNLGERVEGYTNFLWTVLLAVFIKLGGDPGVWSRLLDAVFGAVSLIFTYLLVRRHRGGEPTLGDLIAPALCVVTPAFVCWSSGGLETQLFTALLLAGLWAYLGDRMIAAGVLFALAAMTRPEGMLVFSLTGAHLAARTALDAVRTRGLPRSLLRQCVTLAAAFLAPFGAYYAWRWHYYGWPFPNTYYVKTGNPLKQMLPWGKRYLVSFAHDSPLLALAPVLGLLGFASPAPAADAGGVPRARFLSLVYLILVPYAAYVVSVGGDFMALHRFLVPLVPLAAILVGEAVRAATRLLPSPRRWILAAGLGLAAFTVTLVTGRKAEAAALAPDWPPGDTLHQGVDTVHYLAQFADEHVVMGRWMRDHLPADTSVVVGGAGAIPYESRLYCIDGYGLADETVAHKPVPDSDRPGHEKVATLDYLLSRRPTLICCNNGAYFGHADLSTAPQGDTNAWRTRGYEWGCLHPDGTTLYYCCWHRLDAAIAAFTPRSPLEPTEP